MAENHANGIRVRGADGNLYFVPTGGTAAEPLADGATPSLALSVSPSAAAAKLVTEQLPMMACLMISDEGAARPLEITAAAGELPMMACFLISDDGAERPIEVTAGTKFPRMACFVNVDEGGANERDPVAA
jgi:hypothetical protein